VVLGEVAGDGEGTGGSRLSRRPQAQNVQATAQAAAGYQELGFPPLRMSAALYDLTEQVVASRLREIMYSRNQTDRPTLPVQPSSQYATWIPNSRIIRNRQNFKVYLLSLKLLAVLSFGGKIKEK